MNVERLKQLLKDVRSGKRTIEEALETLKGLPFEDIGDALVDHHRHFRRGFPEVILGEGKTADQILSIARSMTEKEENVLITRIEEEKISVLRQVFSNIDYRPRSRTATIISKPVEVKGKGTILVITAGTTDLPVAEEAMVTAQMMGNEVEVVCDVGVAGIHRLFHHRKRILEAHVLIVVAGMKGALPSIVGGLVNRPVIAAHTRTGHA
jgi:NCAIR mutase (PurE)-related protein